MWNKQQLCNPAREWRCIENRTEITPRRHDWRMNVWLCVMCSRSCSNPIRMVKCSQIGVTLFEIGSWCDTRHFKRGTWPKCPDVPKQLFGFHLSSVWIFFTGLIHIAARLKTINLSAQCPDVRSIYSSGLCLEFHPPTDMRHGIILYNCIHAFRHWGL